MLEKHIEDVKQDQKTIPHLLESIMRPTRLTKEEPQRILMKMDQFRPKIQEFRACTFQMSGNMTNSHQGLYEGASMIDFNPFSIQNHLVTTPQTTQLRVLALSDAIYYTCYHSAPRP